MILQLTKFTKAKCNRQAKTRLSAKQALNGKARQVDCRINETGLFAVDQKKKAKGKKQTAS